MDAFNLNHLLNNNVPISLTETEELSLLLKKYPYFQCVYALQLKGYKTNFDTRYNQSLKITAAYTTDRNVLFDYITSNHFVAFIPKNNSAENLYTNNETSTILIDKSQITKLVHEEKFDKSISINIETEPLEIGKPLSFEKNDTYSFNEWLQLSTIKPINRNKAFETVNTKKEIQSAIIDNFISTNPKIKTPDKNNPIIDISEQTNYTNESLMTETLARVYIEQKKYNNAIKAYKILCLKYPEKSGYFADQIKAIIKIQNNNIS